MTIDGFLHSDSQVAIDAELSQLLLDIMVRTANYLEAERATLFLYDANLQLLWSVAMLGDGIEQFSFPADQGIAGYVMQSGEVLNIADAYEDSRFNPDIDKKTGFRTNTILCQPVVDFQNQCIGVIQLLNKKSGIFLSSDEKMLAELASQSAIAIENAQLYQNVAKLREKEKLLSIELEQSHKKLQQAYLEMESNNDSLRTRLDNKNWLKSAIVLLLLSSIGSGTWWLFGNNISNTIAKITESQNQQTIEEISTQNKIVEVETQEVTDFLYLKGNIRPIRWINVSSPLNSTVIELYFQYGERVKKGQKLALMDTENQKIELREATSAYINALDEFERIDNWGDSLEVLTAKRDLAKAKELLASKERKLQQTQQLFKKGIISRSEQENGENEVDEQKAALISAKENLQTVLAQGGKRKLEIANLTLKNTQQKLNKIKQSIQNAVVYSPANGIIFSNIKASSKGSEKAQTDVGSTLSRAASMFVIADMQGIAIDSEVPEKQILKLKLGQSVKASIVALGELQLEGKISFISERGSGGNNRKNSKFKVSIVIPDVSAEEKIRIGMSAVAKVKIYDNPTAVVVDFDSLIVDDGDYYVQVVTANGKIERRSVDIGSTQVNGVEVTDGLRAGEKIIIPHINN